MAFNPNPPGLGFPNFPPSNPYFPPNPNFPTAPPQQPQAPPRFQPPFRAPPPPRRAPPPHIQPPPRRAPPPPTQPPPPPPRRAPPPPPPRRAPPPPPPRRAPPPPSSHPPPPHRAPPPPSPPIRPPPPPTPHPRAPPPPSHPPPTPVPPPPPSPPPPHIVIIVVFVSLGGLLLLGCLAVALFCWHKKKRGRKQVETKTEVLNFSDHVHVHKDTMSSGPEAGANKVVKLTVDEDIKFQEAVKKKQDITRGADEQTSSHHGSWFWHKKHNEGKEEKTRELINVTGHKHIEEKIVSGPHGGDRIEVLSEDEDIRFEDASGEKQGSEKSIKGARI